VSINRIKKNDTVVVISGSEAGKKGVILQVVASRGRAFVEGINLVKKCMRKTKENPQGGISDKEQSIAMSNLMLLCPECKKGRRIKMTAVANKTIRKCRKCGHPFDK